MTTEHVSVPHKVYENLAQIADGKMSYNDMQDLAAEAYNLLSRATPSDDDFYCCNGVDCGCQGITKREYAEACSKNPSAPRVVTDEDAKELVRFFDEETPWQLEYWRRWKMAIESFATSLPAARVPDGWKLVPVELTTRMAVRGKWALCDHSIKPEDFRRAWSEMLAAAPQAGEKG